MGYHVYFASPVEPHILQNHLSKHDILNTYKMYGTTGVYLHALLTSALDEGEWSALHSSRFSAGEKKTFRQKNRDVLNYCEFLITIPQNQFPSGGL
jgi:hypothetical protein